MYLMIKAFYYDISKANDIFDYSHFQKERVEYIESITDSNRKKQSYYVWKLLLKILSDNFSGRKFSIVKKNDRWVEKNNAIYFSLSHSKNLVAVSVSNNCDTGIDVELVSDRILKLSKKSIFDKTDYDSVAFTKKWTVEECKKKTSKPDNFFSEIVFDDCSDKYVITVCGNEKLENNNLTKDDISISKVEFLDL